MGLPRRVFEGRVERLWRSCSEMGLDSTAIVSFDGSDRANLYYLTGFTGSTGVLVVAGEHRVLLVDGRYAEQASGESAVPVMGVGSGLLRAAVGLLSDLGCRSVGLNFDRVSLSVARRMESQGAFELRDVSSLLKGLRRRKAPEEVSAIERACALAEEALRRALSRARPGMREVEFEAILQFEVRALGGEPAWGSFIVASGPRGSMPHGRASAREIGLEEVVTVDFGVRVDGYVCDVTRNFCFGRVPFRMAEVSRAVMEAHLSSLELLRAGASAKELFLRAQEVLKGFGLSDHFVHSLGHGIGLDVHEDPLLSGESEHVLEEGDVVTIEPGVYLEGLGGVRIEDDYLVLEGGFRRLSRFWDEPVTVLE